MTEEITDLKSYKNRKKYKKLVDDISMVLIVLDKSQQALSHFRYIIAAQEVISIMETNKTLLVLQQKKYQTELDKYYEDNN